jgi:PST family polysaccharide transporter
MTVTEGVVSTSERLDRSLVYGLAWTGGVKWAIQVFSWASTVVVARLLAPTDYGLVGMAAVYLGFVALVNDFGVTAAIVQKRDLNESQLARLGGLALLLSVGFFALSAALAGPIAAFFGEPAVRPVVQVLSVSFVLTALQVLSRSLLTRDLQFRRLAWIDGTEGLVAAAATLLFAASGFRYWALVLGPLAGNVTSTVLLTVARPHRLAWPRDFRTIAGAVTFGWHVAVARIGWYVYTNADFAVVGRVLGKVALGAYTLGWTVASIPVERVGSLIGGVTPAVFAAVQHDRPALRRYLAGLTEGIALVAFPAAIGLALVADEFVQVVLGAQWLPAVMPLRLLAVWAGLRCVTTVFPPLVVATGHAKRNMQFSLVAAVVLPLIFYIGSHWGTTGVALGWLIGYPLVVIPMYWVSTLRLTGMDVPTYLRALWPATSATIVMAVVVLGLHVLRPARMPMGERLAADVLIGAATYVVVLLLVHGARLRAFLALVRSLRA